MDKYGHQGYAVYFLFLELCYEKIDENPDCNFRISSRIVRQKLRISSTKVQEMFNHFSTLGQLSFKVDGNFFEFKVPKILDFINRDANFARKNRVTSAQPKRLDLDKDKDKDKEEEGGHKTAPVGAQPTSCFGLSQKVLTFTTPPPVDTQIPGSLPPKEQADLPAPPRKKGKGISAESGDGATPEWLREIVNSTYRPKIGRGGCEAIDSRRQKEILAAIKVVPLKSDWLLILDRIFSWPWVVGTKRTDSGEKFPFSFMSIFQDGRYLKAKEECKDVEAELIANEQLLKEEEAFFDKLKTWN